MDKDIAACEAKLGKEPALNDEKNSQRVSLSDSITERLNSGGKIDGERLNNYDNYWINKLACIDESHSVRNNLELEEVEEKLKSLTQYVESGIRGVGDSLEIIEKDTLKSCFDAARGETLECSVQVEEFIQEVDRLMYDAVRKDDSSVYTLPRDKLTYAERLRRGFQF